MITAETIIKREAILVELCYPNNGVKQYATVNTQGDVKRLLYFHQRRYIIEKLYSWLNQRKQALRSSPDASKILTVAKLQVIINYHQDISLPALCQKITEHQEHVKSVAPALGSRFFNYYGNTILPILLFCESYGK